MKITDILVEDAVILDAESDTKSALLEEMAAALAAAVPGLETDRLLKVLSEREALQSTGIGEGVAIPHGKVVGLDSLVASFARSRSGIDFDAISSCGLTLWSKVVTTGGTGRSVSKSIFKAPR